MHQTKNYTEQNLKKKIKYATARQTDSYVFNMTKISNLLCWVSLDYFKNYYTYKFSIV